jgi:hypothetical protein
MNITKQQFFWGWAGYGIIGLVYFYCHRAVPLEITSEVLSGLLVLSFVATPIMIGLALAGMLPEAQQEKETLGCLVPLGVLLFTLHNLVFAGIVWAGKPYDHAQVRYPDPADARRQVITQYVDEGAFGAHYRITQVYELTPFLRYVESITYR